MSGNGAQGTKFRISVCTEDNRNKWNNIENQHNIHQTIDKYKSKNSVENRVGKHYTKLNRISLSRNSKFTNRISIKDALSSEDNKVAIIKKQNQRINLLSQLRYLKLMKSSTGKKSYKPRKMNRLLKLCEITNEEDLQEDECFGKGITKFNNRVKKNSGKDIILNALIQERVMKTEEGISQSTSKKRYDFDGTSKLFNTIKFVH